MPLSRVSIIIVTRDRAGLVERAIASVARQDHRPLEIVLIDNQSKVPISPPAIPDDVSLVQARTPHAMNASAARNFGVAQATGAFIGFLDDDDFYLPEKISRQIAAFEQCPEADFCLIDTETRTPNGNIRNRLNDANDIHSLLLWRPVHTNAPLYRRTVLETERFNEALDKYTDLSLNYRVVERYKGCRADGVGAVWICDDRADQLTNSAWRTKIRDADRNYRNWKIICEDFAHLINLHPDLRRRYYGRLAMFATLSMRPLSATIYGFAYLGVRNVTQPHKALGHRTG